MEAIYKRNADRAGRSGTHLKTALGRRGGETGRAQAYPWLHRDAEASLDFTRPSLKNMDEKQSKTKQLSKTTLLPQGGFVSATLNCQVRLSNRAAVAQMGCSQLRNC